MDNKINMEEINLELDKNISQLSNNHEILDNQREKIVNINQDLNKVEQNNSLSNLIIKRLGSLYSRFSTSMKNSEEIPRVDMRHLDNIYNRNKHILEINDNFNSIMTKINSMKELATEMNNKLEEQDEMLLKTNSKVDKCISDIKNNNKSINNLL